MLFICFVSTVVTRDYMVPDDLSWSFTGNQDFEHFGSSITVSDHFDTIVIGSPTYRVSAGGQYFISILSFLC